MLSIKRLLCYYSTLFRKKLGNILCREGQGIEREIITNSEHGGRYTMYTSKVLSDIILICYFKEESK